MLFNHLKDQLNKISKNFTLEDYFASISFPSHTRKGIKNIIIVQFDGIGDCANISGVIDETARLFPEANISFCCFETVVDCIKLNPHITNLIVLPQIISEDPKEYISIIIDKCKVLFEQENQLGLHFQVNEQNATGNIILTLANCKYRFGYTSKKNDYLLTHIVPKPDYLLNMSGYYFYLLYYVASLFGKNIDRMNMTNTLYVNKSNEKNDNGICVSLAGSLPFKRFPIEKLIRILSEIKGINISFIGGKNEEVNIDLPGINYINKLTLEESINVISKSSLYIGNDSGTTHIAAALNVPSIVFYPEPALKTDEFIRRKKPELSCVLLFHPFYGLSINKPFNKFSEAYEECIVNSKKMCTVIQPEKVLYPCNRRIKYAGCTIRNEPHCISTIDETKVINILKEKLLLL